MTTFARDASNYTDPITAATIRQWKAEGCGLVILQAFPTWHKNLAEQRDQMRVCAQNDMPFDCYLWDYLAYPQWLDGCLVGLTQAQDEEGLVPRQLWVDEEDVDPSQDALDAAGRIRAIHFGIGRCDAWGNDRGLPPTGIYTGGWWWGPKTGNSTGFTERKLWAAQYDGIPDATVFTPFGGWAECRVKQYLGSQPDGTDLNVLSDAEESELGGPVPVPEPVPGDCQQYKDPIERGVNRLQIELDRKTSAGKPATLRRTIVTEIQRELFKALG